MSRLPSAPSIPAPRVCTSSSSSSSSGDPVLQSDVPHYVIDLSLPPADRWKNIIRDFAPYWPGMAQQMWKEFEELHGDQFPLQTHEQQEEEEEEANQSKKQKKNGQKQKKKKKLTPTEKAALAAAKHAEHVAFAEGLTSQLFTAFRASGLDDYASELETVSKAAGITLAELVLLNLSYEAHGGCTTILAPFNGAKEGAMMMARTLDWQQPLLRALTVELSFVKQGKLLYRATSFAGFLGIFTGHKPHAFALAVNYRCSDEVALQASEEDEGEGDDDAEMEGEEGADDDEGNDEDMDEEEDDDSKQAAKREPEFSWPVGFLVRHIMESCSTYEEAVERLHTSDLMSQVYFIVCGNRADQGCLITRDPQHTVRPIAVPSHTKQIAATTHVLGDAAASEEVDSKKGKKRPYTKHAAFQTTNIAAATAAAAASSTAFASSTTPSLSSSSLTSAIAIPPIQELECSWLVQANMDHWLKTRRLDHQESLPRTRLVQKEFQSLLNSASTSSAASSSPSPTSLAVSETFMWKVMGKPPIWDEETIYATISIPALDRFVTLIENPYPIKPVKKVQLKKRKK